MDSLNRCSVILRAKEPFREWLKGLPDPVEETLEDINDDQTAYLLPEYELAEDRESLLEEYATDLFEEQLNGWWQDEGDWPLDRSYGALMEWFAVEFHSLVLDVAEMPLVASEWDEDEE
jgi:hypothetical protein